MVLERFSESCTSYMVLVARIFVGKEVRAGKHSSKKCWTSVKLYQEYLCMPCYFYPTLSTGALKITMLNREEYRTDNRVNALIK